MLPFTRAAHKRETALFLSGDLYPLRTRVFLDFETICAYTFSGSTQTEAGLKSWRETRNRLTVRAKYVIHDLWRKEHQKLSKTRNIISQNLILTYLVLRSFFRNKLFDSAGALVYTTLFSLVPFLAVLFAIMKGFAWQEHIATILSLALHPLGEQAVQILVPQIMGFVMNTNIETLGYIGFVLLLGSLLFIISTIESSFNAIWRVRRMRAIHRLVIEYIGFLFIGPVIGIAVLGWSLGLNMLKWSESTPFNGVAALLLKDVAPFLVTLFIFYYLAHFIPNTRVKVKSAFVGALVGATLWTFSNWLFSAFLSTVYVEGYQAAIYARLAVLPLLLIWLYVGWTILLFAAQVAYAHQNIDKIIWDEKHPYLSPLYYENLSLKILLRTYQLHALNGALVSEEELSDYFRIPEDVIHTVVEELATARYLVILDGDVLRFVPAKPADQVSAADVMLQLRHIADASPPVTKIDRIAAKMSLKTEATIKKSWSHITLRHLLDHLDPS